MASLAVAAQVGPKLGLFSAPVIEVAEAATQTFKRGAVITISAGGYANEGGTNPTSILGIAMNPGQNLTTAGTPNSAVPGNVTGNTMVIPTMPHVEIEMNLDNGAAYALLQTDLYAQYGLTKDGTTGIWYVDQTKTAGNARVTIVGFKDAVGATTPRVYVIFKVGSTVYN